MGLGHSPTLDITSLQLLLDSANSKSYAGSGTTWTDLSGNARNFTLVNGPYENYGFGGSIYFDGVDDYASSSYAPVFTGDFTIQCWVNFKTYINYQNIISSANSGSANYGFWLEFGSARGFTLYQGLTGASILILEDNIVDLRTLATNTWHHVCVVRSGSGTNNVKLYVNNVLCGQSTYTNTIGLATQNLLIARYSHTETTNYFNGYISNLLIQHSAITSEVLAKNYAAMSGRFNSFYPIPIDTTSLVLNLDAGNPSSYSGSGSSWIDLSGNSNTGTLNNSPTFTADNGGYLTFNGSTQFVSFTNSNTLATAATTIEVWMYTTSVSLGYQLIYGTSNYPKFYLSNANLAAYNGNLLTGNSIPATAWKQVVLASSSSSTNFYIDGAPAGTTTGVSWSTSASTTTIGKDPASSGQYFSGRIASVKVYSRVLTQSEIFQNYNALRGRFGL